MGSSKGRVTGYNYSGSVAQVVCMGPVKTLHAIYNGDTIIFTGPVHRVGADLDGKTVLNTSLGTMHFYWGTSTQNQDPLMAVLKLDYGSGPATVPTPNYRGVCYVVCQDMQFGSQTTPPTLQFEVLVEPSGLTLSQHSVNGDALAPEVIYQILTNTLWGLGLAEALIDKPSFQTAAETLITDGIGISPVFDAQSSVRETLGKLYPYGDLVLYWSGGKLKMRLLRWATTAGLPSINESDLLEEPRPSNQLFRDTWNYTVLNFKDRATKWEQAVETYEDAANFAVVEERVEEEVDFPFVTLRSVAKILARRAGIRGGVPRLELKLKLHPSWITLSPGDRFLFSHTKLAITNGVFRVESREIGGPGEEDITIDAVEDDTRDESKDYTVPTDNFDTSEFNDADGADAWTLQGTTPRLLWLPSGLKVDVVDGMLVALNRVGAAIDGAAVHFTWDPLQSEYREITLTGAFPAKGTLLAWSRIRANSWLLRIEFDTDADYEQAATLCGDSFEVLAVTAERIYRVATTPTNEHQVKGMWAAKVPSGYAQPVATRVLDIEVVDGRFGSDPLALESGSAAGLFPCAHIYFGRREDFVIHLTNGIAFDRDLGNAPIVWDGSTSTDPDAARIRYIKAPTYHARSRQAVADATASTYDRDDPTMCPDGTLSIEWGDAAPTLYELFDILGGGKALGGTPPGYENVQDIDEALWRLFYGNDTAIDVLLFDALDAVLGAMVTWPRAYYSPA